MVGLGPGHPFLLTIAQAQFELMEAAVEAADNLSVVRVRVALS